MVRMCISPIKELSKGWSRPVSKDNMQMAKGYRKLLDSS